MLRRERESERVRAKGLGKREGMDWGSERGRERDREDP